MLPDPLKPMKPGGTRKKDAISYNLILLIAPSNDTDNEGNLIISDDPYPELVFCSKVYKRLMKFKNDDLVRHINAIHPLL